MNFDWHSDPIARDTPLDAGFRKTQNVRRFLTAECGPEFRFDRVFMAWLEKTPPATMGDVADEWSRRAAVQSARAKPRRA